MFINIKNVVGMKSKKLLSFACFIFSFLMVYFFLYRYNDMVSDPDSRTIWESIQTFYSGEIAPTYVLYKGISAIYPYVWLYQLANVLGLEGLFFVRIYYSLLFAYATTIGVPFIVSRFLKKDIHFIVRILTTILAFFIWKEYSGFGQLAVDLPNFAFLTMAASSAIVLTERELSQPKMLIGSVFMGLLFGVASGGSGQYRFTSYLLLLYLIWTFLKKIIAFRRAERNGGSGTKISNAKRVRILQKALVPAACILIIVMGNGVIKAWDSHFDKTVVQPLLAEGAWIPSSKDWAVSGLSRNLYRMSSKPPLPDNRGTSIIIDVDGDAAEARIAEMQAGGNVYTIPEYMRIVFHHPVDFLARWGNRLFWALSMVEENVSAGGLFLRYTLLFVALLSLFKNCKAAGSIFTPMILIFLSYIIPTLVPCFLQIESRYIIATQALIICAALADDAWKTMILTVKNTVRACASQKSLKPVWNGAIPYALVLYAMFMCFCMFHYATIMETLVPVLTEQEEPITAILLNP